MTQGQQPIQIIGNESNMIYEIEPNSAPTTPAQKPAAEKEENPAQHVIDSPKENGPHMSNDLATNDGSVVESLDTAFHNKPGVAEGLNPSGSDRADYYESRLTGKSDSEEELGA